MSKLLLVDDEARFAEALAISLRPRGYEVHVATTGESGLETAARLHPDVIVLDLGLPGIDGLEVLRGLRAWTEAPVVVLSAREAEHTKVEALDAGADDYVTKPFGMDELVARLRAVQRRRTTRGEEESVVTTEHFSLDLAAKRATVAGATVRLTPKEWLVVEALVRNAGRLVSQRMLLQAAWGPQYQTETEYLRVFLASVRRKLEPIPGNPRYFVTEPGMGYRFEP
jgi:two-component system KDP operon response regulator KdpE